MSDLSDYVISLTWGLIWRYGLLLTAIVVKESGYHPPLVQVAIFAGVALTGAVVGVWRSRSRFAALWRMVTLSVLVVFVAPGVPEVYPYVVVLAITVATVEPFLAARRRRRRIDRSWRGQEEWQPAAVDAQPSPSFDEAQQTTHSPVFPAIYSDDGRFLWNGAAWVALPPPMEAEGLAPAFVAGAAPPRRRRRSRR